MKCASLVFDRGCLWVFCWRCKWKLLQIWVSYYCWISKLSIHKSYVHPMSRSIVSIFVSLPTSNKHFKPIWMSFWGLISSNETRPDYTHTRGLLNQMVLIFGTLQAIFDEHICLDLLQLSDYSTINFFS